MDGDPNPDSMRLHPGCLLPFAALLIVPLSGCYVVAAGAGLGAAVGVASTPPEPPAGSGPWRPGAALSIDFTAPRDLAAGVPGDADSLRVRGVTRVVGRVRRLYGDTLMLALTEVRRTTGGPLAFALQREPVALVLPDASTRVQQISVHSSRTTRGLGGGAAGALLTLTALVAYCRATGCLD